MIHFTRLIKFYFIITINDLIIVVYLYVKFLILIFIRIIVIIIVWFGNPGFLFNYFWRFVVISEFIVLCWFRQILDLMYHMTFITPPLSIILFYITSPAYLLKIQLSIITQLMFVILGWGFKLTSNLIILYHRFYLNFLILQILIISQFLVNLI